MSKETRQPTNVKSTSFLRNGESIEFVAEDGARITVPLYALLMLAQKALCVINATQLAQYSEWLHQSGQPVSRLEVNRVTTVEGERVSLILVPNSGFEVIYNLSFDQARELTEALIEQTPAGDTKVSAAHAVGRARRRARQR